MKRAFAALALFGCEAIAPVDLHYVGGDGGGSDAHPVDSGVVEPVGDADPGSGPNGLCGCDFTSGEFCCIPSNKAPIFCTTNGPGCAAQGGVAIGCDGYDQATDSMCCWSGPAQPGNFTRLTTKCASGPASCATSADCSGGTCVIQKCGTVNISACDVTPACP
jgi:hypothetical protein